MMPIQSMTEYPHIGIDTLGRPTFVGKRFRLSMLIGALRGPDKPSVEVLCEWYPVLTKAEIHSGLAYYFDHQSEVDELMERENREVEVYMNDPEIKARHEEFSRKLLDRKAKLDRAIQ